jgi:hypothetical protein
MKFNKVVQFRADDVTVEFHNVDLVGFSHKVLIFKSGNLIAKDWLSDEYRVSEKHAAYYCDKHADKIA